MSNYEWPKVIWRNEDIRRKLRRLTIVSFDRREESHFTLHTLLYNRFFTSKKLQIAHSELLGTQLNGRDAPVRATDARMDAQNHEKKAYDNSNRFTIPLGATAVL